MLLVVDPLKRPSCEQILHTPAVEEHLTDEDTRQISMKLLQTIKMPRGNMRFAKPNLPQSQYEQEIEEEKDSDNEDDGEQNNPFERQSPS